ncbi:TadE/TadG family type IV pilus assembly protein [Streptomyces sp. CA-250714]|uniref:TadE/TadG family type IV pilus assembly protein n=1 Tax=Streptomyces sp. CA-250714 TaxID=3240060 RepID=UPI003D8A3ECF
MHEEDVVTTWWNRISQAARTRIQAVRGRLSDAGYSVMEWVFITAAGANGRRADLRRHQHEGPGKDQRHQGQLTGRWWRQDQGNIEVSVAAIIALMLLFLLIQGGLWLHGRSVAQHAAQQGADAGRSYTAQRGDAAEAAERFVAKMGGSLQSHSVSVETHGGQIAVTVRGEISSLVPGVPLHVEQRVQAPVEEWTE